MHLYLLKYALTQDHRHIKLINMKMNDFQFDKNKLKWNIAEAFPIKQYVIT